MLMAWFQAPRGWPLPPEESLGSVCAQRGLAGLLVHTAYPRCTSAASVPPAPLQPPPAGIEHGHSSGPEDALNPPQPEEDNLSSLPSTPKKSPQKREG